MRANPSAIRDGYRIDAASCVPSACIGRLPRPARGTAEPFLVAHGAADGNGPDRNPRADIHGAQRRRLRRMQVFLKQPRLPPSFT